MNDTKHTEPYWLPVSAAAALAGISIDTLKRWETAGRITAARTPTGHRRYRRTDVESLLNGGAA